LKNVLWLTHLAKNPIGSAQPTKCGFLALFLIVAVFLLSKNKIKFCFFPLLKLDRSLFSPYGKKGLDTRPFFRKSIAKTSQGLAPDTPIGAKAPNPEKQKVNPIF